MLSILTIIILGNDSFGLLAYLIQNMTVEFPLHVIMEFGNDVGFLVYESIDI